MLRKSGPRRGFPGGRKRSDVVEALETRRLLSAAADPVAHPLIGTLPAPTASPTGFTPAQINAAYGINDIRFGSVVGNGAGQTIAIVVAYDDPDLVDSTSGSFDTSDLHEFDVAMGLPDPPSFTKVDEFGHTTTFPTANASWADETALDVEWTHAIAPDANIVLVEAYSADISELIDSALQYVDVQSDVSVVNLSFSVNEFDGEVSDDSYIHPSGSTGKTFVAAAGDSGDVPQYPASSPDVVSVGDTALTLSGGAYGSETAVGTSGGGVSAYEPKPAYQYGIDPTATGRVTPDVSIEGSADDGLAVYDSYNGGDSTPWYDVGGSSAAAPLWSGLIAITDQGRAQLGLTALDGPGQTLPRLYSLNGNDFHDVSTGQNGNTAGPGYDISTGLGTPIADQLVPDLAGGAKVSGTIFDDTNGDGVEDDGETGFVGYSTFVDLYGTDTDQGADFATVSTADGAFSLADLPGGTYRIAQPAAPGVVATTPTYRTVNLSYGSTVSGVNLGYKPNGDAAELAFSQQPSNVIAGELISPAVTVAVEDADGNLLTSDDSAVTLTIPGGTALGGTTTVDAVDGIATFADLSVTTGNNGYTLQATDGDLRTATSAAFNVSAAASGTAVSLGFLRQPADVTVGSPISPAIEVQVLDSTGAVVGTDDSAVTLSLANGPSGATLGGTVTVDAVDGVATFPNITVSATGTATLTAVDGVLAPATSGAFSIEPVSTAPVASQLAFSQQPTAVAAGSTIAPSITVDVDDSAGAVVTTDTSAVTLAIANGPAGATLGGTVTVNAVGGVATFTGITASAPGTYTLTATDASLTAATSAAFTVSAAAAVLPSITGDSLPASTVAGSKVHGTVVITEKNLLTTPLSGTFTTDVYAEATGGASVLLGSAAKKLKLAAGKSFSVSVPVKLIPATLDGTYSIYATATDPTGTTATSAAGADPLTAAAPYVALSPAVTKLTLPASVVDGKSKATAAVKIANSGNIESTDPTTVSIYASPDGAIGDATLVATLTKVIGIKSGGSATVTVPLKEIPTSLDGSYTILAEVSSADATAAVTSSGTTVQAGPPVVSPAVSDLSVITSGAISPGKPATVSFTIEQTGNVPVAGTADIAFGLSYDGRTELTSVGTDTKSLSLTPGKPVVLTLKFTIPASAAGGLYYPFLTYTQDGETAQVVGTKQFGIV